MYRRSTNVGLEDVGHVKWLSSHILDIPAFRRKIEDKSRNRLGGLLYESCRNHDLPGGQSQCLVEIMVDRVAGKLVYLLSSCRGRQTCCRRAG